MPASTLLRWETLPTPELIALAQAGNREAFDPLYRRYARRLFGYALGRVSGDVAAAEDLAAETWTVALVSIGQWHDRGGADDDFVKWLVAIARHRSMKVYHARWQEFPVGATTTGEAEIWLDAGRVVHIGQTGAADDVDRPGKQELRDRLRTAVDTLPAMQRDVTRMRLDGARTTDIARVTGRAAKQIQNTWRAARAGLRKRLVEPTVDVADLSGDPVALRAAVNALPPVQREVVRMRLDGVPSCDIADATGRGRKAVASAWHLGKRSLRDRLAEQANAPKEDPDRAARRAARQNELNAQLRVAAESLPPAQREVALMRLDGARARDIVRATGRPKGTISANWYRACAAFARQGLTV